MSENNGLINPVLKCRGVELKADFAPLVMGILNVTPDSFSDGGTFFSTDVAVERALEMVEEGAAIIDVGGESTRPGAMPVDAEEEERRVIPVVRAIASQSKTVVSIDTTKARVASQALDAGAHIINDISSCTFDPDMPSLAASSGAGVILMHMQGTPRVMQHAPHYKNVVGEVLDYLVAQSNALMINGVKRDCLAIDPGIGFGKNLEHNLSLLTSLDKFAELGLPVVAGVSRKSFLGLLTGKNAQERLAGSIAATVFCALKGVQIVRVHDVKETVDAMNVVRALRKAE